MTIEISDETYRLLQERVERGHYDTLEQALDDLEYVQERIEAGLADVTAGRVRPAEEVLAEMQALRTQ